jgi:major type 1 subunit fimbrin (pilin)
MTGIEYRIDPVTTVLDSAQSVVALDGSSSASGTGVQLLDSTGTHAFPLGQSVRFNDYNPATGGSYGIPLQARYYQTGASIGVGTANTSMTFTMTYE